MTKKLVDTKNSTVMKRGDYTTTLNAIIAGGFCPFCEKHLFKHHRKPLEYKSRHWLVTRNAWPYEGSRYHFLFITRAHAEATENISPSVWADLQKLYKKVVVENDMKGATFMIRSGDTRYTGASVNHLHAHLVSGNARTKKAKPIKALVGFGK